MTSDDKRRRLLRVEVFYEESQGSSFRYRVRCEHGRSVRARTRADALDDKRHADGWCDKCAEKLTREGSHTPEGPGLGMPVEAFPGGPDIPGPRPDDYCINCCAPSAGPPRGPCAGHGTDDATYD